MDDATAPEPQSAPASPLATIAWIVCSALLVALIVGVWMRVGSDRASANLANAIIAGERPPAPALPDVTIDGTEAAGLPSWYRTAGKLQAPSPDAEVLVVNWWASWCGPCKDEAPALTKIAEDYEGSVTVVGMNAGAQDLESDARAFVREYDLRFTIVRGARVDEEAWGTGGFPETYIVGTDGRISSFVNGPIDEETLRGLLDVELKERRS